jgi:hypothetical protein
MPDAPPSSRLRNDNLKPPKEATPKSGGPRPMTRNQLSNDIAEQLTMAGMMIGQPDPVAGYILCANAQNFGDAWADVAQVNPRVKAVLEKWFSKTVYANAGTATLAVVLPMATHYRLMPKAWFNPASDTVKNLEGMVNPEDGSEGVSFSDLLMMDAEAKARAAAAAAEGFFAPEPEAPDHYEAPTD